MCDSPNGSVPADVRGAARYYVQHNLPVVPVPPGRKYSILEGWPAIRITTETVNAHFPADLPGGVALLNGVALAGGRVEVDVDLDSPEAIWAAEILLPATARVFGRRGARRAHRRYAVTDPPRKSREQFRDPARQGDDERNVLVELLSVGSSVLAPPSVHPNGESLEWETFGPPAEVDAGALRVAVGRVAATALIGRYWPVGGRHDGALALAGVLLGLNWTVEDAERFVTAVVAAAQDEERKDRVRAVRDTAERRAAGKPVTGWPMLAAALGAHGGAIVGRVRSWLCVQAEASGRRSATGKPAAPRRIDPYIPFPAHILPEPVHQFVAEGAAALRVDPAFLALPVLAVVASAIGNTRTIRLKRGWDEPSVIWSVIVGDSGCLKSPAYRRAVAPLFRRQKELADEFHASVDRYEADLAAWEEAKRKAKKDGSDPGPRPERPVQRRVVCSDTTIEKLAEILGDNPRGVPVVRDELSGWMGSFGRYKGRSGGTDLPHWLEAHVAGAWVVDRKTAERPSLYVPRAGVSVTGGIQPGVLAHALTPEFLDAGLAARLLVARPPKIEKEWTDMEVSQAAEDAYRDILRRLSDLEFDTQDGEPVPNALKLSVDAKAAWVAFYNQWGREQAAAEGELASALSKLEGYAARFALIHHVVTHVALDTTDLRPVGVKSIEAGVTLCRWFAGEARRLYATLSETADETDARRLVEFIQVRGGRITARALQKSNSRKYRDAEQAKQALDHLVGAELGYWTKAEPGPKGGKPAAWFVLSLDTTTDTTDSTPDDDDPDGGQGARQYPPAPDTTPRNVHDFQQNAGSVGTVGSGVGNRSVFDLRPSVGGGSVGRNGVVSDDPGTADVADATAADQNVGMADATAYVLVTNAADLTMVVSAVEQTALVGLDIETTGLDPRADRVRLLSLATDTVDGSTFVYVVDCAAVDPSTLWPALRDRPVVGHNLLFDLQFLARLGFEPGEVRDSMLMSQVLYAGSGALKHSLAAVADRELGLTVAKDEQASDWSGALKPEQLRYAALDADLPRRLNAALAPKLDAAGLAGAATLEHRALPAVAWLAGAGVGFDRDGWAALACEAEARADQMAKDLDGMAPARPQPEMFDSGWNWDSPGEMVTALAAAGCPVEGTRDAHLAGVNHPLAATLRDYRAARKLAGTYGTNWLAFVTPAGRIHAGWRQVGANSGRMACSQPNLQNLPRDARYRRCFVAPQGRVLVKADYSQIELRIAAQVAGEERMAEAYRKGEDLHTLTARQILGRAEVTKHDRQLAKAVNFGLLYGMGARGFRVYARTNYGIELSEKQAQDYRTAFFSTYSALRRWHQRVGRSQDRPIETRTLAGRRCLGVARFNEKLNLPVQGTGADGLKAALGLLWERREQAPGAVPVLVVHDEIVIEVDADLAEVAAAWLRQAMLDGMAPLVAPIPVEVEVSVGRTWAGD